METGVINGGLLRVYISTDGIDYSTGYMDTSADLSITSALKEAKTKDSGVWDESIPGTFSWSISGEKLYTVTTGVGGPTEPDIIIDDLLNLMIPDFEGLGQPDCINGFESKLVVIKFMTPQGGQSGGWYYQGNAYITDISINSGNDGENATASYTLTGIGPLLKKTV